MKVRKFKIKIRNAKSDSETFDRFSKDVKERFEAAKKRKLDQLPYDFELGLPDVSWLDKIFSPERMRLIMAIRDRQPESVYELAKCLDRTPTNVLRDVHELEQFGILELKKSRREGRQQEILRPEFNWDGFEVQITPKNMPKKKRAA